MRTRLIALVATLGITSLAAASLASATARSGGGGASGGGTSASGGAHGSGGGGGAHGGGSSAGGHLAGGAYRGGVAAYGGHAGFADQGSYLAHGGYVAHGDSGYHIVGYESAGLARAAAPRNGHGGRIALAMGPRMGSAARAIRLVRATPGATPARDRPRPGHHPRPKPPLLRPYRNYPEAYAKQQPMGWFFCDYGLNLRRTQASGCVEPVKAKVESRPGH